MFLVITINNIACDTCKYKEDCNLLNKFINDIKDKGLSPDQINLLIIINKRISLRILAMMKFMLNLNVEKQINLLNNLT
nr:MAG: hypothetical protein [Bacteriophage sp.]